MCPIIDVISDETFEYVAASDLTWGGRVKMLSYRVKKFLLNLFLNTSI